MKSKFVHTMNARIGSWLYLITTHKVRRMMVFVSLTNEIIEMAHNKFDFNIEQIP